MIPKAPSHSQLRMLPKVPALEFANPGPMIERFDSLVDRTPVSGGTSKCLIARVC